MSKELKVIAKANVMREDGKVFGDNDLKLHANESPEKYFYDNDNKTLFEERREDKR